MSDPNELTHLDAEGLPRMVDVGGKAVTARRAVAVGRLQLDAPALAALTAASGPQPPSSSLQPPASSLKKGDPWPVVHLAAVQGVKRTPDLIPLAHPLIVDGVAVAHHLDAATRQAWLRVEVRCTARTGVEMEALTGVSAGLLALYDMLKAVSHGLEVGPVRLLLKEGGRHGAVHLPWIDCPWEG
ncbi:MAG TPA: cyclic pyranopterin monophosphate synthase MoaC [Holophagaceae bacterium]|nr:cyclic pyranopterin monophosphate synthase MoaC [Holophagaceae bacterium]